MERLRQFYLRAFRAYAEQARRLQSLTAQRHPDKTAIDAALLDLEKARWTYNQDRDALASALLRAPVLISSSRPYSDRVRSVASLRWEVAGRPEGTAEEDWFRAEEIVGSAA
jgi:hypothetical protein